MNKLKKDVPTEGTHTVQVKIDGKLKYKYNFAEHDGDTRTMVAEAQQRDGSTWSSKRNMPEPAELHEFAQSIYSSAKNPNNVECEANKPWKLLYQAKGKVFFKQLDGFYGELYYNNEKHSMLLVIKGTSSVGNVWSDLKNVGLGFKGGEIDSAFTFGEKVRKLILQFKVRPMLLITGHSLGGYLSQIITYTITYCYVDNDGTVRSREEPSDEFGMHTTVFDSPAAYTQINSIDPRDPLDATRFMLPIVNFVVDVNIVNSNSVVGPHFGLILAIKDFNHLKKPDWAQWISNTKLHGINNFTNIESQNLLKMQHLPSRKSAKYNERELPSFFFSVKNFERLNTYAILAPLSADLMNKIPTFKLSGPNIIIQDSCIEEFFPRALQILSQFREFLDNGELNGKKIVDMKIFNMWRAEKLKDSHSFCLNEESTQRVKEWSDGTKIGGFETYEEMRFFGCLLHNSIPACFHYDYEQFLSLNSADVQNFTSTTEATLVLIVKDKKVKIDHQAGTKVKILYLMQIECVERITINFSILNEESKKHIRSVQLNFMGNQVSAENIFGDKLLQELPVCRILNFHYDTQLEQVFYSNQEICSEQTNARFESASEFAHEIKNGEAKLVLISSDAGMGKSTALKQIALVLQQQLPHYLIAHFNLFSCQSELRRVENCDRDIIELVRNMAFVNLKEDDVFQKVYNWKVNTKQMVILMDSLDEVCPLYREAADKLISQVKETGLLIVVTTRPTEGQNLKDAHLFKLEPLHSEEKRKDFVKKRFSLLKKSEPPNLSRWLNDISIGIENDFWSVPLSLVMAVYIYGTDLRISGKNFFQNRTNLYSEFIHKSILDTLDDKIGIDKNKASSADDYQDKIKKYLKLVETLAICSVFHFGVVQDEYQAKVAKNGGFINRFVIAKLDNDYRNVSFLHKSYAEYLTARVILRLLTSRSEKCILDVTQINSIWLQPGFRTIRAHICGILAASPIAQQAVPSDFIQIDKKVLLQLFIKEDCFELYLLLKDFFNCPPDKFLMDGTNGKKVHLLYFALEHSRENFVKELIKDGADFGEILHKDTVLHLAVEKNLFTQVKCHIEILKSNINRKDHRKSYPLQYAAMGRSLELVELLLEHGAHVDAKNALNRTALYYAIKANSLEIMQLLIAKGAKSSDALLWAAEFNQTKLLTAIYEQIPDVSETNLVNEALFVAARHGQVEFCKDLCDFGANPLGFNNEGETSVHLAAERGHLECVQFLTRDQKSVDVKNEKRETPLMMAIAAQRRDVVVWLLSKKADVFAEDQMSRNCFQFADLHFTKLLIENGAKLDRKDTKGWTALMYAAHKANADAVQFLLDNASDPQVTDDKGNTCLHLASRHRKGLQCVQLLADLVPVNCSNEQSETPLHLATSKGLDDIIAYLLERGADPNLQDATGKSSLLIVAIDSMLVDVAQLLIEHHADVNATMGDGNASLHLAARAGNAQCVALLVGCAAEVNHQNEQGCTALMVAAKAGHEDTVKYLLNNSADPTIQNNNGDTCLHLASRSRRGLECVKVLVNFLPVDCTNHQRETPLHLAASCGLDAIASFLLERGAEVDRSSAKGWTALFYATKGTHADTVHLLLRNSANPHLRDNDGNTCLHLAVSATMTIQRLKQVGGNYQYRSKVLGMRFAFEECDHIVVYLLESRVDPNLSNVNGETSLHMAAAKGSLHTVKLMVKNGAEVNAKAKCGSTPADYANQGDGYYRVEVANYLRSLTQ